MVVFTTDHGDHFKTRVRNDDNKRTCHDSAVRIPLMVRGGPFCNGMRKDALTSTVDVLPTLLDAVDISVPESSQGRSLVELTSSAPEWRDAVLMQIWGTEGAERAIRTDRYKMTARMPNGDWWYDFQSSEYEVSELYDLRSDPYELENKVNLPHYRSVQKELEVQMAREMSTVGEKGFCIKEKAEERND